MKKILIVDDEKDIVHGLKLLLEETNRFSVDYFTDSNLVIPNFKTNFYDLLLLDIRMPNLNGFELYHELKKQDKLQYEKVCFITAYEIYYEVLKKEFPNLNVGCFISKPIGGEHLVKRIDKELS